MFKAIAAGIFTAVIVGAAIAPSFSESVETSVPQRVVKGDRLAAGTACPQAAWPYYDRACVRGAAQAGALPREVRIVTADRLPMKRVAVASAD